MYSHNSNKQGECYFKVKHIHVMLYVVKDKKLQGRRLCSSDTESFEFRVQSLYNDSWLESTSLKIISLSILSVLIRRKDYPICSICGWQDGIDIQFPDNTNNYHLVLKPLHLVRKCEAKCLLAEGVETHASCTHLTGHTNAISISWFSTQFKDYLSATMSKSKLNDVMKLHWQYWPSESH